MRNNIWMVALVLMVSLVVVGCGQGDTTLKISDSDYGIASATSRNVGPTQGSQNLLADLSNLSADAMPTYEVASMASAAEALGYGKFFRTAAGAVYVTIE
jgi:hypothetical protein